MLRFKVYFYLHGSIDIFKPLGFELLGPRFQGAYCHDQSMSRLFYNFTLKSLFVAHYTEVLLSWHHTFRSSGRTSERWASRQHGH